jgi:hypothetical protein
LRAAGLKCHGTDDGRETCEDENVVVSVTECDCVAV